MRVLPQLLFVADDVIERLILPKRPVPPARFVDLMRSVGLPRVQDRREIVSAERSQQHMHMVRHDRECAELIASAVEMAQRALDDVRSRTFAQHTRSVVLVEFRLEFFAEKFAEFGAALGAEAGRLLCENGGALFLPSMEDWRRQSVGEPKRDEICGTGLPPVR